MSDRITVDPKKALDEYSPSERRAILVHRYFLGIECGREPSILETISSWEAQFARNWRRSKVMKDLQAQLLEIEKHKFFLSEKAGYDIGWEAAARDWVHSHAGAWRDWWERQDLANP